MNFKNIIINTILGVGATTVLYFLVGFVFGLFGGYPSFLLIPVVEFVITGFITSYITIKRMEKKVDK